MAKLSNEKEYDKKCINGARVLIDYFYEFRLLDGYQDEKQSYFLLYYLNTEKEPTVYIELTLEETYELLALSVADVAVDFILMEMTTYLNNAIKKEQAKKELNSRFGKFAYEE